MTKMNYKKNIFTIPNIVSFVRIIIVGFAASELLLNHNWNSFILYLCAVITDFLDGFLSRALNQISDLGKILDPLADKLMIGSAIIILLLQDRMPSWYVIVIVACSAFNLLGGIYLIRKHNFVPPSILIGKIAAVATMFTFLLNIVNYFYIDYLYYTSATLIVISTFVYIKKTIKTI